MRSCGGTLSCAASSASSIPHVKGIGFCVNVGHATYMARMFSEKAIPSAVLTGDTSDADRGRLIEELRAGKLTFLFTVDVLNEGLDVPEINTVLFLRPTESLTIPPPWEWQSLELAG